MYKQLLKKFEIESSLFRRDENTDVNVVFRNTIEIIMLQGDARKLWGILGARKHSIPSFAAILSFPFREKEKYPVPLYT